MISQIKLKNFRNHENLNIDFKQKLTYIYGSNGVGKTSILESIHLISTSKSHKTNNDLDLIKTGSEFASIQIFTNKHLFEMIISKQGKRVRIDKSEKNKVSDFIGHLNICMFAPEDLQLVKGTPSDRRKFMDIELIKVSQAYLKDINQYYKILKQRNSLLKNLKLNDDETFLNIVSHQLYDVGSKLYDQRSIFLNDLNQTYAHHFKTFSNHQVSLIYDGITNKENFKKHLFENQKQDIILKTTNQGPHRDDFNFVFDGFKAKAYVSQGQARLMVIALKLSLLDVIIKITKQEVVLLLDDLFSELDENIMNQLLEKLPRKNQIIMTSTQKIDTFEVEKINLDRGI